MTLAPKLVLNDNFSARPRTSTSLPDVRRRSHSGTRKATRQCSSTRNPAGARPRCYSCFTTTRPANSLTGLPKDCPIQKSVAFSQALYDKAKASGWHVISMKDDWKRIFSWQ